MNIAIVEDEEFHCQILSQMIKKWGEAKKEQILLQEFSSAESFLFMWEENKEFDVIFLDICMKQIDGVELAKKIRETDKEVSLIFATNIEELISEGYEVQAMHYLIKPLKEEKVFAGLDKAAERKGDKEYLIFRGEEEMYKFERKKVVYVEADAHYAILAVEEGKSIQTYRILESMTQVWGKLENAEFIKCHRSYICNLLFIHSIKKFEITFDSGVKIPISRRRYQEVNDAFIRFYRKIAGEKN